MAQPMRLHLGPPPSQQQQQQQQFQQQGQQQFQQPQYAQQPQPQYAQQPLQQQLQYSDALPPRGQLSQFPPQQQQQQQHFQPQQFQQPPHSYPPAPASYDPNPASVPPAQPGMSFVASSQSRMSGGGGSGPLQPLAGQPQQQFMQQQQQQPQQQFSQQPQPLHHLTPLQAHRPPMVSVDGGGGGGMGDSARFTTTEAVGGFYDANTERPSYPPSLASTQEIDSIRSPSGFASQQQQQHQQQPAMQGTGPMGLPPRHSGAGNVTPHIGGPQIPDRPPVVMRLASTRAPFSPHALKGDGPSPARETMSPTTPATAAPALPPLMASLEELLAPASLQPYLPFVQGRLQAMMASGFQPAPSPVSMALGEDVPPSNSSSAPPQQPPSPLLVLLMDLDEMQTEGLFDEVEAEAEAHAVYLRPAHRDQITKRVREERTKRATVAEALLRSRRNRTAAAAVKLHSERNNNNVSVGILGAGGVAAGSPVAGSSGVGMDGMRGLLRHWCCCLGLCVMSLLVAVAFLLLYTQLGEPALNSGSSSASSSGGGAPSGGSVNGAGVSSTAQGGWKFLYILSIVGFILAGFAALAAVLSWLRNPLTRSCNPTAFCSSCREVQCKKDCCGECPSCSSLLGECAGACGCAACMEEGRACLSGCCAGIKDQCSFAMPDCPDCQCPSCATLAADCGCADCCPADNGPGFCDGCCEGGCCADCGECSAPSCECDCCPDCEGDIRGCCAVLYKVCCCQCKIQVS
jgi:hypothetical protein